MIHLDTNYNFHSNNVSFTSTRYNNNYIDYSHVVGSAVLPKGKKVKVANNAVLELGLMDSKSNYVLCMSDRRIQNIPNGGVVSIGRKGTIQVPNEYGTVSRDHLYLYKYANEILIEDVSSNQTVLSAYKDYTHKPAYTMLPKQTPVVVNENTVLRLANSTVVDLASPEMKKQLSKLEECKVYTLGKEGDIRINTNNPSVSRKHLEIMKTSGKIIINDISINGTTIGETTKSYSSQYDYGSSHSQSSSSRQRRYSGFYDWAREEQYRNQDSSSSQQSHQNHQQSAWDEWQRNNSSQHSNSSQPKQEQKSEQTIEFEKDMDAFFKDPNKAAYRNLAAKWHPDKPTGDEEKFTRLHEILEKKGYVNHQGHWIEK